MTIYEAQILTELADWYVAEVRKAIETKPIKRRSKGLGDFEAVANNTGMLAKSLRRELTNEAVNVYAMSYIDKLVFGQQPGTFTSPLYEIEQWLAQRGLEYNSATIAQNIDRYGSSIYQRYQGANSGLLDDIPLLDKIEQVKKQLALKKIEDIRTEIMRAFAA